MFSLCHSGVFCVDRWQFFLIWSVLNSGCNTTKCDKSREVWILSEGTVHGCCHQQCQMVWYHTKNKLEKVPVNTCNYLFSKCSTSVMIMMSTISNMWTKEYLGWNTGFDSFNIYNVQLHRKITKYKIWWDTFIGTEKI